MERTAETTLLRDLSVHLTFTAWKRVVPLPIASMQAGQHRVSDQHVTWIALKGYRLAGAVVTVDDVTIGERRRILTVLKLISCRHTTKQCISAKHSCTHANNSMYIRFLYILLQTTLKAKHNIKVFGLYLDMEENLDPQELLLEQRSNTKRSNRPRSELAQTCIACQRSSK